MHSKAEDGRQKHAMNPSVNEWFMGRGQKNHESLISNQLEVLDLLVLWCLSRFVSNFEIRTSNFVRLWPLEAGFPIDCIKLNK